MKTTVDTHTLIVYLEGSIDSSNAESVQAQIEESIARHPDERLQFDATNLTYISSAGLRVLLFVAQQRKEKISIVNVSPEVFDIFETTGFTELFFVRKPLRQISVEGLREVGSGVSSIVYQLDTERIIKVYRSLPTNTLSFIEQERNVSKEIFLKGIPTAIPFDIVKTGKSIGGHL